MTDEEKRKFTLQRIASMDGPHPKASTNTKEHWQGVANAMKGMAAKALAVRG